MKMKLTAKAVAALELPAGKDELFAWDTATEGFGVRLRRGGSRAWVGQARVLGRTRRLSLGAVGRIELEAARSAAKRFFAQATLGADPAAERAKAREKASNTFGKMVGLYIAACEPEQRANSIRHVRRYLERYFAKLHNRPVDGITRADVATAIREISTQHGRIAGARARATLSALYAWGMGEGLAEANPVLNTNRVVEKPRERVLAPNEIAAIWRALPANDFGNVIRLLFWTACRRSEVGELRWSEVEFDRKRLIIPGERIKTGHALTLPLAEPALALLRAVPRRDSPFVFGRGFTAFSAPLGELRQALAVAGDVVEHWTPHDIRRTIKTQMSEAGVEPWVSERILNHTRRGVEGVYDWSKLEGPMRVALTRWADRLHRIAEGIELEPDDVVTLKAAE